MFFSVLAALLRLSVEVDTIDILARIAAMNLFIMPGRRAGGADWRRAARREMRDLFGFTVWLVQR
jgi:hypothetical protein